jgi:beta-N-acetylhexosaminidase
MPVDEDKAYNEILAEVKKDEALKQQVYESVKRIIRLKICLGLIR